MIIAGGIGMIVIVREERKVLVLWPHYRDGSNLILYGSYDHEIGHLMLDNIINLCSKYLSNMHLPDDLLSKETAIYF